MDITLERILSLIPSEKDGRFKKYAAADFASKIGVAPNLPSEWKAGRNKSYKTKLQTIADTYYPYVVYIRYQRQMAAYTGEAASVVLFVVISQIKAATRV